MKEAIVFVVDDDPAMRRSTCMLLAAAGLRHETFERAADFLDSYDVAQPGCLVLDLSMPGMSGMDLVQQLRAKGVRIPILIVSGTGTIPLAVEGMKLGVVDFFEKPANPDLLLQKVQEALAEDAKVRQADAEMSPMLKKFATLTPREKELLQMLVNGMSSKQIANELKISIKTVENHRSRLLQKTGALNIADLTRMSVLVGNK